MRKSIPREGSTLIRIACYAAGDGMLSFVAYDQNTGAAVIPIPSESEALAVCPIGWELFEASADYWRARPINVTLGPPAPPL